MLKGTHHEKLSDCSTFSGINNQNLQKNASSSQMTIGSRRMLPYYFSKSSNAKRSCVHAKFSTKDNFAEVWAVFDTDLKAERNNAW